MNQTMLRPLTLKVLATAALLLTPGGTSSLAAAAAPQSKGEFPSNYYFPNSPAAHRSMEGKPAPSLKVGEWIGTPVDLAMLKGNVVVVDFWGTWCPPCMASIPHNVEMVSKYGKDGLVFIGVHDSNKGWEKAARVVKDKGINYSVARDASGGTSERAWNVHFWPTYAVIDRKGTLRAIGLAPNGVEPVVKKLLAEKADPGDKDTKKTGSKTASDPTVPRDWLEGTDQTRRRLDKLMALSAPPPIVSTYWPSGAPQSLAELRGKVVLLHFWSTRKQAAVASLGDIARLSDTYEPKGLVVISICHPEGKEKVAQTISENRVHHAVCVDEDSKAIQAYDADNSPDCYLIDRSGTLRIVDVKEAKVEDAVKKLLAEPAPE